MNILYLNVDKFVNIVYNSIIENNKGDKNEY